MLTLAFNILPVRSDWTWTETIYIRADGNVEPDTAPILTVDNITYTLTDNIVGDVPEYSSAIVVERDNIVVDGAGYTIEGIRASDSNGVNLTGRSNVTIKNTGIKAFNHGIHISESSNNTIHGNNIIAAYAGIYLSECSNNTINENNIDGINKTEMYPYAGIRLSNSSSNTIYGNNITTISGSGISIVHSSNYNTIFGNHIEDASHGIRVFYSSNNRIFENHIENDHFGAIYLYSSSYNTIYHNNFMDNRWRNYGAISSEGSTNTWDNGTEGNYWGDYTGEDQDGDGIGDTPYVIDENNQDSYPLMSPWSPKAPIEEEVPFWLQWWFYAIVAGVIVALVGAVYFLRKRKQPTPTAPTPPAEGTV